MSINGERLMKTVKVAMSILTLIVVFFSCQGGSDSSDDGATRSFYMGFTPWPYAATVQAVTDVYAFINAEGDLVAHHFQQGVPFTASDISDFSTYHENIRNEINGRTGATASGRVIYLAIDSLNSGRNDLTDLWGSNGNMDRPDPWDARGFGSAEVIQAYIDFSTVVIEKFRTEYGTLPAYFNYGTEISELMINEPGKYTDYYTHFAPQVYSAIKAAYPSIKLMVSIALKSPGSAEMNTVTTGFTHIKDYVDVVGISTYGYAFYGHADKGNPDNLPSDWITQVTTIAPGKPYGVTETGWIGEDLSIPAYTLNVFSDGDAQDRYLQKLFAESNDLLDAEMIIWFTSYDFDTLWTDTLGQDNVSKIWKDTGLIDENFNERPGLDTWEQWKALERR